MSGQILAHTPLDGSRSPGATGSPAGAEERIAAAVAAWGLASGVLRREISPEAALVLAEPVAGPVRGTVSWRTPLDGFAREFSALSGIERQDAERDLRRRASDLAGLAARLSASRDDSSRSASRLLSRISAALGARAAGLPGSESVWVVGGVPVLAGWGIPGPADPAANSREGVPTPPGAIPSAPLPPVVPPPASRPPGFHASPGVPPSPAEPSRAWVPASAAYPAAGRSDAAGPGLLKPSLAALGVFLLAIFLFWTLSPDFRSAAGALPGPALSAGLLPDVEDGLRAELQGLRDRYRDDLRACLPDETPPPVDDSPPSLPQPERRGDPPPSAGDAPQALEAAPPPPPPPPPEEPKADPAPAAKPKPATKPNPPKAASAPKPKAGGRLQIPQGATDVGFLKGCWKSDAGIFNRMGVPLYCYYCFDGNGHARVRVEEMDRRGRVTQTCTASATARLSGGKLHIRDTGAKCPRPPNYAPDTVVCTPTGSAANCQLQSDGGKRFPTRITYQGG